MVARGSTGARDRWVTVCSPLGWTGTLTVRPHAGLGLVAVVLARGRADIAKDLKSADPAKREEAAKKLQEIEKEAKDEQARRTGVRRGGDIGQRLEAGPKLQFLGCLVADDGHTSPAGAHPRQPNSYRFARQNATHKMGPE